MLLSILSSSQSRQVRNLSHFVIGKNLSDLQRGVDLGAYFLARTYVSRAHPQPKPVLAVGEALNEIMADVRKRRRRRQRKWNRNEPKRLAKGKSDMKVSHPDETIELAINLNLDPRKPGQSLRGSITLPHGTGKTLSCIVFTEDEQLQQEALSRGAKHAGGSALVDAVSAGEIPIDSIDQSLATSEIMPILSKKLARLLGPRGLMPNVKTDTLLQDGPALLVAMESKIAGKEVIYRTEKAGVVHLPVGKASFGLDKLLENIGQAMKEIFRAKPEQYGKGKKKKSAGKDTKYLLNAYLSSTQGPGILLDPRTVDPGSPFFLSSAQATTRSSAASSPGVNPGATDHTPEAVAIA